MTVASIYLTEDRFKANTPFCYHDTTRAFITSIAPLVEHYYVFTSRDGSADELIPEPPSNVHVMGISDLFQCASEQPIHVWHDFGYGNHRTLDQLRRFTRQEFSVTGDFRIERVAHYADTGCPDWGHYDGIVYPNEHMRQLHLRYCSSSQLHATSVVIPPGSDLDLMPALSRTDARRLLGFSADEVLLLCLSDFSPRHGTDLLPVVTAFELLASERDNVRLVISGSDNSGLASNIINVLLDKAYSPQVTVLANPDEYALAMLFAAADIFIHLPDSPAKDSPLTLLYAMGHKLAIVAARWPSSEALLEHLQSGILLQMLSHPGIFEYLSETLCRESNELSSFIISQATVFDIECLKNHLRELVDDSRYRKALGTAAFNKALQNHQTLKTAGLYISFWKSLKKESPGEIKSPGLMGLNWFKPDSDFFGSATPVSEDCSLHLAGLGEAVLNGKALQLYDGTAGLLFNPIILEILKHARTHPRMRDLLDTFSGAVNVPSRSVLRSGTLYHLLLCLKRGFLCRR